MRKPPVRSGLTAQHRPRTTSPCEQQFSTFQQRRTRNSTSRPDAQDRHRKTSSQEQTLINEGSSSHPGPPTTRSTRVSGMIGCPPIDKKPLAERTALASHEPIVPLTGHPFFITVVTKTKFHLYRLDVPKRIQQMLPRSRVSAVLSYGNKTWEVKYGGDQVNKRFCDGWGRFAVDNGLDSGDACVFELMDSENLHFKVQILRAMVPTVSAEGGDGASEDAPILID